MAGFRPELWRDRAGRPAPAELEGFNARSSARTASRCPPPSTTLLLWLAGSAYDVVFDEARAAIAALAPVARVAHETSSWPYRHDRDLTGFVDGTENPSLAGAPEVALVAPGAPGAGGSVLLLQRWAHDATAWDGAARRRRRRHAMGRTKADSVELGDRPDSSARRAHRPGRLRPHLPAQHALRHGDRPRHDVRGPRRRAGPARRGCSRAWRGATGRATSSPATPRRRPAPTTSYLRCRRGVAVSLRAEEAAAV